jgi:hypothetical protein
MCYRREDSADVAGRIYDRLVADFGNDAIYRDVDKIPFGVDFREHIRGCLSTCLVGLVVIGPEWCTIAGRSGRPRLHEAADQVRLEVETLLARGGRTTIPLYVRGAESPDPEALPEALRPLTFKNGGHIRRDPDFHHDMDRVLAQLRQLVKAPQKVVPPSKLPMLVAEEETAAPVDPPAPGPSRPFEPAPVAIEEARAPDTPLAENVTSPSAGSERPGRWQKFVARLPRSRTCGWIWVGLSAFTGVVFLSQGEPGRALYFLLMVLLSPLVALAHWRDGHRVAAICAPLYTTTLAIGVALNLTSMGNTEFFWWGVVQLTHSGAWAWWCVKTRGKRVN